MIGNGGTEELHVSATGPIGGKTAFRLTAYDKTRDGFFHNLYDDSHYGGFDRKGLRGQLLDTTFENVALRLIAEHYDSKELFANSVLVAPFTGYPICSRRHRARCTIKRPHREHYRDGSKGSCTAFACPRN